MSTSSGRTGRRSYTRRSREDSSVMRQHEYNGDDWRPSRSPSSATSSVEVENILKTGPDTDMEWHVTPSRRPNGSFEIVLPTSAHVRSVLRERRRLERLMQECAELAASSARFRLTIDIDDEESDNISEVDAEGAGSTSPLPEDGRSCPGEVPVLPVPVEWCPTEDHALIGAVKRELDDDVRLLRESSPKPVFIDLTCPKTEDIATAVGKLVNPLVKVKKDRQLTAATIWSRLQSIGLFHYDIPGLTDEQKQFTFSRLHLTYLYGGNPQETFPIIAAERRRVHGVNDLAFFSLEFNPHAPQYAGAPGLLYSSGRADPKPTVHHVFTLIRSGKWLHAGTYRFTASQSLSPEEFSALSTETKLRWAKDIISRHWGFYLSARIYLRLHSEGREPTEAEISELCRDGKTGARFTLTEEDVILAYVSGQEEMGVYCMKCVGYDVEWQNFLIDSTPQFEKDEVVRKAEREVRRQRKSEGKPQSKGKRKSTALPGTTGASGPNHVRNVMQARPDLENGDDGMSEDDAVYMDALANVSKGTRSRPRVIDTVD